MTLGVVHIPKCGGTAINGALVAAGSGHLSPLCLGSSVYGPLDVAVMPARMRGLVASPRDLARLATHHPLVMGHVPACDFARAGYTELAVMVREPRSRLLSQYRFLQGWDRQRKLDHGRWLARKIDLATRSFDDFLDAKQPHMTARDCITRWTLISTRSRPCRSSLGSRRSASYERFRERAAVVEWSRFSESYLERLCERAHLVDLPSLDQKNVTEVAGPDETLDKCSLARLDALTATDRSLLDQMMVDGVLRRRSPKDLEEEFRSTAERLHFSLG